MKETKITSPGRPQLIKVLYIVVTFAVAAFALPGCGTMQAYSGARLPREQVAVIDRQTHVLRLYYGLTVMIVDIDGLTPKGYEPDIEILPGEHHVKLPGETRFPLWATPLVLATKPTIGPSALSFRAEAGGRYKLATEEVETATFVVWVENEKGSFVGGLKPKSGDRPKAVPETEAQMDPQGQTNDLFSPSETAHPIER
jgi:hypothetical protein